MIEGLTGVEFERPQLAYASIPLAALVYYLLSRLWRRLGPAAWTLNPLARWAGRVEEPRLSVLDAARILLLALVFVAAANPHVIVVEKHTVAESREARLEVEPRPGLVIMLDVSGSMAGEKLADAVSAVRRVLDVLDPRVDVGLIAFNDSIALLVPPTSNRTMVEAALAKLEASGGTMYRYPMTSAYSMLRVYREHGLPAYLVIVSDGIPADAEDAVRLARTYAIEGIKIHAVLIGPEAMGLGVLEEITGPTGGQVYNIADTGRLGEILEDIAGRVNKEVRVTLDLQLEVKVERREPLTDLIAYAVIALASLASVIRYRRVRAEP